MVRENVLMFAVVCGQVLWSSNVNMADSAKDTALFGAEKETKEDVEFALDKKTIRRNKL